MSLGKEIFSTGDRWGPISVWDDGSRRYLTFGEDDEQSCQSISNPFLLQHDYSQAMMLVLLFVNPRSMMLLGVGGGCLATTLHHYFPALEMVLVELREPVLEAARCYFQLPEDGRVTTVVADADKFIRRSDVASVDILFCDLYGADGVVEAQTRYRFIETCASHLQPSGWLVINYWRQQRDDPEVLAALQENFAEVRVCATAEGNWIVLAGLQASSHSDAQLKTAAKKLSRLLGYSLLPFLTRMQQIG